MVDELKPRFIKRKRFKRKSDRKLTARDLAVLDFLWTWKVASTALLGEVAFRGQSAWWVYKALAQLKDEHYIQALPRGRFLDLELWALTDQGFEVVLMDRDDLAQYRFKPHAPAHDYLGTCLQLGAQSFHSSSEREYFTEQMLSSLLPSNFPRAFRRIDSHIPDGLTLYRHGAKEAIVGYEVDLNLKDEKRYLRTLEYYTEGVGAHLVIWLVKNAWIAEKITTALRTQQHHSEQAQVLLSKTAFVGLDDFKERIWESQSMMGALKGVSVSKLHANLLQSMGKSPPKYRQINLKQLFFSKYKSPQKFTACAPQALDPQIQHPTGVDKILEEIKDEGKS